MKRFAECRVCGKEVSPKIGVLCLIIELSCIAAGHMVGEKIADKLVHTIVNAI